MEIWKDVVEVEGYQVSSIGRVRNKYNGRILHPQNNGVGYRRIGLGPANNNRKFYVHRLMASAFLGQMPKGYEVNHIDGNRSNNVLENLEWVTSSENTKHAVYKGILKPWGHRSRAIKAVNVETGETKLFATLSQAEKYVGSRHITDVLKGRRQQCKGYYFEYLKGGDASADFDYFRAE